MSPIALILNLTLGALLLGAMILGQRLDRRLRALRESHNSFAKAVAELDQAARRTQDGLNELKATAEDARTALADRIDSAREWSERMTKLTVEAQAKTEALERINAQVKAPRPILLRASQQTEAPPPRAKPAPAAAPAPRSRAAVDDELFESVRPSLSAFTGGRR
jgi:hypothetical protein